MQLNLFKRWFGLHSLTSKHNKFKYIWRSAVILSILVTVEVAYCHNCDREQELKTALADKEIVLQCLNGEPMVTHLDNGKTEFIHCETKSMVIDKVAGL